MENENICQTNRGLNVQNFSALLMLLAGTALATVALFMPPQGEISASVCTVFAQCLIYAGSALGIAQYLTLKDAAQRNGQTSTPSTSTNR